jgi:hypothetical protein
VLAIRRTCGYKPSTKVVINTSIVGWVGDHKTRGRCGRGSKSTDYVGCSWCRVVFSEEDESNGLEKHWV